ncbi:MAG TPA: cytochrome c biogenesis protein CcdA, partial [bacterium]|nr:cytochrome c biogenesis protein CcdA [bacterium]
VTDPARLAAGVWTDTHLGLEIRQAVSEDGTPGGFDFFPLTRVIVRNDPIDRIEIEGDTIRFRMPLNPQRPDMPAVFEGILLDRGTGPDAADARAYHVRAPLAPASDDATSFMGAGTGAASPAAEPGAEPGPTKPGHVPGGFWTAILLAFAGGIVLNLMPCVLPVLSLKILGIVQHARDERRQVILQGILFTLGILVTFWLLAGMLIVLKAGGQELGWGFQLQSPAFVGVISILLFLFSLSLFGLFEIGGSLTAVGGDGGRHGKTAAFLSGVTATVVATPCTAPFMGTAMGYALFQPAWVNLTVFTVLGFGMAVPYLFISLWPGLARRVPKPGSWMVHLKESMGFLLLGTVVWLAWIL